MEVWSSCACVPVQVESMADAQDFYLRYYVGHKGQFGHEFLEIEFRPDGEIDYLLIVMWGSSKGHVTWLVACR